MQDGSGLQGFLYDKIHTTRKWLQLNTKLYGKLLMGSTLNGLILYARQVVSLTAYVRYFFFTLHYFSHALVKREEVLWHIITLTCWDIGAN